jgi:branched-chain amino acid transport system permease protein
MRDEALATTPQPRTAREIALPVVALALMIALPFAANAAGYPTLTSLATRALIFGMAAASLNFILGYGGMVSFGHAAFFGLGGYTVGILHQHAAQGDLFLGLVPGSESLLVTLPAAMLVAGAGAALIGALSLRTSGVQFIMITLAFAQMLFFLFVSLKMYGGDDGLMIRHGDTLPGLNLRDKQTFYYVCLALSAAFFALFRRAVRSRFGMALAGLRQSERRMAALGLFPYPVKLAAFVLAGMGAGLAGCLMANFQRFVSPDMVHWTMSGELMIMVVLGGVGTLFGPLIGAVAYLALESILGGWSEHWQLGLGLLLLVVVLFTGGGLQALFARLARGTP